MKIFLTSILVAVLLLVGSVLWSKDMQKNDADIISTEGLHSHPELSIYVNDEKQEIPMNIGLMGKHKPIHTHEDLPIIHLEFTGIVRKQDITLGEFFKSWGKDMESFGTDMVMAVNDEVNTEHESYVMQDKDKIELRFN